MGHHQRHDVGEPLQRLHILVVEMARLVAVRLQHPEDVIVGLDQAVDRAADAVVDEQLRDVEALLAGEVVGDGRNAGLQGQPGRRSEPGRQAVLADDVLSPADAGTDQQRPLVGQIFHCLDVAYVERVVDLLAGDLQQRVDIGIGHRQGAEAAQPGGIVVVLCHLFDLMVSEARQSTPGRCVSKRRKRPQLAAFRPSTIRSRMRRIIGSFSPGVRVKIVPLCNKLEATDRRRGRRCGRRRR